MISVRTFLSCVKFSYCVSNQPRAPRRLTKKDLRQFCRRVFVGIHFYLTGPLQEIHPIDIYLIYPTSEAKIMMNPENHDRENDFEIKLFCTVSGAVEELGTKQGNL